VEYRRELMHYLDEYPDGAHKDDLKGRLYSYTESGFYSVCFELYLYHFLEPRSYRITLHPDVPGSTGHPDFGVECATGDFMVEAVLALDSQERRAQEQRLNKVIDALRNVRGNVAVWAQLVTALPNAFPLRRVRSFLEREVDQLDATNLEVPSTITFTDDFNGTPVIVDFLVMDKGEEQPVIGAWSMANAQVVTAHQRIKLAVATKANKYGTLSKPYVIAVWPRTQFPVSGVSAGRALYGDLKVEIPSDRTKPVRTKRALNGIFNTLTKGHVHNRQISAVLLYKERFLESSYERQLCIYHNPYALIPLPTQIFAGVPQLVPVWDEDENGRMEWLDDRCPWDE
jgi:hypothetical protein